MSEPAEQSVAVKPRRRWLRWVLVSLLVLVFLITLLVGWAAASESGLRTLVKIAKPFVPDGIVLGETSGRLLGPLSLSGLRFDLPAASGSLGEISIDWQLSQLGSGVLLVEQVRVQNVSVTLNPDAPKPEEEEPFVLPEAMAAPIDVVLKQLLVEKLQVTSGETVIGIASIDAAASWRDTLIELERLAVAGPQGEMQLAATVDAQNDYPLDLAADIAARVPEFAPAAITLSATGTLQDTKLSLKVAEPYRTQVTGTVTDPFETVALDLTLAAKPAPLQTLSATLPDLTPQLEAVITGDLADLAANATLQLAGAGMPDTRSELVARLKTDRLVIESLRSFVADQPTPVTISGELALDDTQSIALQGVWPDLLIPMADEAIRLQEGKLQATGTLAAFQFDGGSKVQYANEWTTLVWRGTGTQESAQLEYLRAQVGSGELELSGDANWRSGVQVSGSLLGTGINPAVYVAQLPGDLDVTMKFAGAQSAEGVWSGALEKLLVGGELLELPLAAAGSVKYGASGTDVNKLRLRLGDNRIEADGTLGQQSDLDWSIELEALDQFSALAGVALKGTATGGGEIAGDVKDPSVNGVLKAAELGIDDQLIERAELSLTGSRRTHNYSALVVAPQATVELAGAGDLQPNNQWLYQLRQLDLSHPDLEPADPRHEWGLRAETRGMLSAQKIQVAPLCLVHRAPTKDGEICVSAEQQDDVIAARVNVEALQLSALNGVLPDNTRVAGVVNGELGWNGAIETTVADVALEGLTLFATTEKDDADAKRWETILAFAPSVFSLQPADKALDFSLRMPLRSAADKELSAAATEGVFVTGQLSPVADQPATDWPLGAEIGLNLPDLSWVAAFVDELTTFDGDLVGKFALTGTGAAPTLDGQTTLSVPTVAISDLGIEITDTKVELLSGNDGLQLNAKARSGDGALKIESDVVWQDGLKVQGTMQGTDFTVSDSALARARISPDLRLKFVDNKLTLRGDVVVPLADVRLAKLPEGAVAVSRDQRFPEQQEEAALPIAMDARVRVVLGDEVSFEGLGLKASFGGALTVSEQATGTTTGTGEIRIKEGTYKAYGQDLSVENGKVIFAGGPIESPGLDIRAVRQATPEVSVGVQVVGSVVQPKLELFSTPALPQSDQLSYLVLGRPLASGSASENSLLQQAAMAIGVEGGQLLTEKIGKNLGVDNIGIESAPGTGTAQAALVVGKYLSPRLYVSYGYGLFEPISTLRMEYELSRLWRIVTQSTNQATGGDILWVLER